MAATSVSLVLTLALAGSRSPSRPAPAPGNGQLLGLGASAAAGTAGEQRAAAARRRGNGASGGDGGITLTTGSSSSGAGTGGTGPGDGGSYLIYASTDTMMFTLDPTQAALTLTTVGTYDCIGPSGTPGQQSTAMTDLAVDQQQNIWGLSSYGVRPLTVQGTTVHCGAEIYVHVPDPNSTDPSFPYIKFEALTFAPVGVIKPGAEALVAGNTAGGLYVIDPTASPAITQHGAFGTVPADDGRGHAYKYPGMLWELSGDIVFLANGGSPVGFATVRDCPAPPDNMGCNQVDTLIEIDMTALATAGTQSVLKQIRGQVLEATSCGGSGGFGFGNLFGIASWNGDVYGFARSGDLLQISNDDGTACLVKTYPTDLFSGAAVTTLAPVTPPPPTK